MKPFRAALAALLIVPAGTGALEAPPGAVTVLDRYGRPLRVLGTEDGLSRPVALDQVSPWMVLSILAAEDRRFYDHRGVDPRAVARALWSNVKEGRTVSGGSTVTQQLVRLLEPRPRTLWGKVREAAKALRLERTSGKAAILEAYLNRAPFGNRLEGIEAAARAYFRAPAADLSLAQAALLAGIPQSPARHDPVKRLPQALKRRDVILGRLESWGWVDAASVAAARAEKIEVRAPERPFLAPHFTEFLRRRSPGAGPWRATLDAALQAELEGLLTSSLARLEGYHVTNGAVLVLDNATGGVLAWVGSADFFDEKIQGQVDGVTAPRQPGSALKPFLYGLAFSRGMTPADVVEDTPHFSPGGFAPKNYDETFHGAVRLRESLACSYNIPAIRVGARMGMERFLSLLHGFGFDSLTRPASDYGEALPLGDGEVTLLELTNAYAALARGGLWKPVTVMEDEAAGPARQALDEASSHLVLDVLSDDAARARAFGWNSPLRMPFPFAAKTGTSKDYRDNWAVGATPDWTVGVWVGNFDGSSMRRVSGITGAAPLLHDAAVAVERRLGHRPFRRPPGIIEADVCPASGLLPSLDCPGSLREVFRRGTVPRKACALHTPAAPPATTETFRVTFPAGGDVFQIDPHAARGSQVIRLQAAGAEGPVRWSVDGAPLADDWWPLRPGRHRARAESGGRARSIHFLVVP